MLDFVRVSKADEMRGGEDAASTGGDLRDIKALLQDIRDASSASANADVLSLAELLSIFFAVPTLAVGFYGMNFSNMPFLQNRSAWKWLVVFCIVWVMAVSILLLRKPNSFDAFSMGGTFGNKERNARTRKLLRAGLAVLIVGVIAVASASFH